MKLLRTIKNNDWNLIRQYKEEARLGRVVLKERKDEYVTDVYIKSKALKK